MQWSGNELTLLNGEKAAGVLEVPNSTTRIAYGAFQNNANITAITIPESVRMIEGYAFAYCSSLQTVNLNNGLAEIGDAAFAGTQLLAELRVPDSVTKFGNYVKEYGAIYLPDNITEIGYYQGDSHYSLLIHADSITARTLGRGRTKNNYSEAMFCDPNDHYLYAWLDGRLYLMGPSSNVKMFRDDIYGIRSGYEYAYYNKILILPSGLRELWSENGGSFFGGETQSITFPDGLTTIPANTDTSSNLNAVVIPRSVISINDGAFGEGLMTVYGYASTEAEAYLSAHTDSSL